MSAIVTAWDKKRAEALTFHNEMYLMLSKLKKALPTMELPELVDVKHCLRLIHETVKDLTKEVNQTQELVSNVFATHCLLEDVGTIHGSIATGWAKSVMMITPPTKGDPNYIEFLSNFGIPPEAAPFTSIHYPTLIEHATTLMQEGRSLKGVAPDKMNPKYTLVTRGIKDGKED